MQLLRPVKEWGVGSRMGSAHCRVTEKVRRVAHSILYEAFSSENLGTTIGTAQESVGIK